MIRNNVMPWKILMYVKIISNHCRIVSSNLEKTFEDKAIFGKTPATDNYIFSILDESFKGQSSPILFFFNYGDKFVVIKVISL